jgi:hypothetical protein
MKLLYFYPVPTVLCQALIDPKSQNELTEIQAMLSKDVD